MTTDDDAIQANQDFTAGRLPISDEPAPMPDALEGEPMVVRGVRLPVDMDRRISAAAKATGVDKSTLIREFIELGLTEMDNDQAVSLADVRRAIAHLAQTRAA
jgi:predicted DNA-binding protein